MKTSQQIRIFYGILYRVYPRSRRMSRKVIAEENSRDKGVPAEFTTASSDKSERRRTIEKAGLTLTPKAFAVEIRLRLDRWKRWVG